MAPSPVIAGEPRLSICIPTYRRAAFLERCLAQLDGGRAWPFPWEIVVSDNASDDETASVVASAAARGLPVRYLRQRENVGAERNVASALRAARGLYAVYLGDDDRLDLARIPEVLGLFDENPSLACVQAPWRSWDDATGRDLGPYYQLDTPAAFTAADAWPCWQYLLRNRIFPEIAIYRTRSLHAILHVPRTVHWAFVWCFRLLGQGTVAFLPVPFYQHVVRPAPDLPPRRQLGVEQAGTHLDRYRGGLEWSLAAALRSSAGYVPAEKRAEAQRLLTTFLCERAEVAARVAAGDHDFVAALEHHARALAWSPGVDLPAVQAIERSHTMLAGLQAVAEIARSTAGVRDIRLCGLPNTQNVVSLIGALGWEGPVTPSDPSESGDEGSLWLVGSPNDRTTLIERGVAPGLCLVWEEVADLFRLHNPIGAAQKTRSKAV